jgi:hypothetical protein
MINNFFLPNLFGEITFLGNVLFYNVRAAFIYRKEEVPSYFNSIR